VLGIHTPEATGCAKDVKDRQASGTGRKPAVRQRKQPLSLFFWPEAAAVERNKAKPIQPMKTKTQPNNGARVARGVLLTGAQLAEALGVKERSVITWRQRGTIPYLSLGYRSIFYRLDAVEQALAKRQIREVA